MLDIVGRFSFQNYEIPVDKGNHPVVAGKQVEQKLGLEKSVFLALDWGSWIAIHQRL